MGLDICALVTDWEPVVAACRAAGGLDFYWDANMARNERFYTGDHSDDLPELPFLVEVDLPGGRRSYLQAAEYYAFLRQYLPAPMRAAGDATFGLLLPHFGFDWAPERRDDLATDAGVDTQDVHYALRPDAVRTVLANQPQWDDLLAIAEQCPEPPLDAYPFEYPHLVNAGQFEMTAGQHLAVLESAAAQGQGVVVIISY